MQERPIIFKDEMVRAVLADKKTQTRRVIKPQPAGGLSRDEGYPFIWYDASGTPYRCPYGKPGSRIWVKENYRSLYNYDGLKPSELGQGAPIQYQADMSWNYPRPENPLPVPPAKWRSSLFMPYCFSRITLEITDVRVERVWDITESDARAEGAPVVECGPVGCRQCGFANLWDAINAKKGFGWKCNPWVWVIVFKRRLLT